jgi:hypothetical protein
VQITTPVGFQTFRRIPRIEQHNAIGIPERMRNRNLNLLRLNRVVELWIVIGVDERILRDSARAEYEMYP